MCKVVRMWIKTRELSSAKAEGGKKGWVVGMTIVYISVYSRWEEGSGGFGLWVDGLWVFQNGCCGSEGHVWCRGWMMWI